jgi:transcriptional regulator with XRE-family HTH domain
MPSESRSLREVVGESVARLRRESGVRQDDIADRARLYGLRWSRSRVALLERGEMSLGAEELALLPLVLTMAFGREIYLTDLLPEGQPIRLNPSVISDNLAGVLADSPAARDEVRLPLAALVAFSPAVMAGVMQRIQDASKEIAGLGFPDPYMSDLERWEKYRSETEQRMTAKLGVSVYALGALSEHLWGRSFTAERDERAAAAADMSARSLQAFRGQISRNMLNDLRNELDKRREVPL